MPTITAIKAQRRKERYNIFLDGEFAFGIDAEALLKEKLAVGVELSEQEIERLRERVEFGKLFEKALNFLSYRPRSEREVRDYLKKKLKPRRHPERSEGSLSLPAQLPGLSEVSAKSRGFACARDSSSRRIVGTQNDKEGLIEEVIEKLKKLKYVDDQAFAKWWVDQRRKSSKPRGSRLIRSELFQKGIAKEIIEEALQSKSDEVEDSQSDLDLALKAAEKKLPSYHNLESREFRRKMGAYLARRGFEWEVIREVVSQLTPKS